MFQLFCSLHPISHFEIEKETGGNVLKTNNIKEETAGKNKSKLVVVQSLKTFG